MCTYLLLAFINLRNWLLPSISPFSYCTESSVRLILLYISSHCKLWMFETIQLKNIRFFCWFPYRDHFKDPIDAKSLFGELERVWTARRAGVTCACFTEASVPCNKLVLGFCFLLCCYVNYGLISLSPLVLAVELKVLGTGNCYSAAVWNNNWELTVEIADWVSRNGLVWFYRHCIF